MLSKRSSIASKDLSTALIVGLVAIFTCNLRVQAQTESGTATEAQAPLQGQVVQQINNLPPINSPAAGLNRAQDLLPYAQPSVTNAQPSNAPPFYAAPPYTPPAYLAPTSYAPPLYSQPAAQNQRRAQPNSYTPPPLNTSVSNLQNLMQSMSAIQGMAATGTMQGLPGGAFPYNGQSPQQMQGMTPLAGMQALQNLQGMAAMQLGLPANSLQGNVQQQQSMQALQALKFLQNAQPDLPSLRMAPPATRPDWLPGYAYTNDYMVAPYHNFDLSPWDKSKIPQHRKVIRLSESVTKFWHGDVSQPCLISLEPLAQAPGNFSFASEEPNGPRGWLQDTNEANSKGYPIYRYWFAQSR